MSITAARMERLIADAGDAIEHLHKIRQIVNLYLDDRRFVEAHAISDAREVHKLLSEIFRELADRIGEEHPNVDALVNLRIEREHFARRRARAAHHTPKS